MCLSYISFYKVKVNRKYKKSSRVYTYINKVNVFYCFKQIRLNVFLKINIASLSRETKR